MINTQKISITSKIFLLVFDTQVELSSTFLRFQEHYESPKFRNKIFSLEEFKEWYIKDQGKFSYYTDWNGFNIPSKILKPFYEGKFNPLSEKEKQLLSLFKNIKGNFYIIGVHRKHKSIPDLLNHEIAHGLFYTDKEYKNKASGIIKKYDTTKIQNELSSKGGYHKSVLLDEVHAYGSEIRHGLKSRFPKEMRLELKANYKAYLEKNKAIVPKI
ncbi:ABC transporter ATP-binding protein [Candidatus Woesearchaeota archaeon]|nr:ABC transporter ATP-binding protein [Candidatus Woesearchaeota archaeon]